jgi:DNA-binding SARP family transcriptional activator
VEIRLLGPLEVRDGERLFALRPQQRALLAALALRIGEVVPAGRLVLDLWGARAPAAASGSLQNAVSGLRKTLGREILVTQAPGYRLALEPDAVDANRFEHMLAEARTAGPAQRATMLEGALQLWRGPALADLEEEFARLEAGRLDELRVAAVEEWVEAELELGRHVTLVGQLERLVAEHPLRERLRGHLMLALYRCGRQAEALEVYRAARLALAAELGLDPSAALQELERMILRQDPDLAPPGQAEQENVAPVLERRMVSVLAAIPPAEDDPETLRLLLDELLARSREVLARTDGLLERFGPEGLVAVFGADGPRDDDALRAVRAAAELGLPAGIATGESVGGAGAVFTRAVELAHRGGIQVDERTRTLTEHERHLDAPLVGRSEELARLRAAFTAAKADKHCGVITILGEPGIGKTRLARELTTALATEATTLVGRCFSYGKGQTFLPLLDALQRIDIAATLADDPEGELAINRLATLAGTHDAGTLGETYWALRRLLEALARAKPVLILLDDVHWAEPALLDLVDYLAEHVTEAPVFVLLLARPEVKRPIGEQLPLGPLSSDETRQLMAGVPNLDTETRERVVELANGNALYAEQLAAFATEQGAGLPATLEAVLAGRIGQLADPDRRVTQCAAVAGREFSRAVLAWVSDEPVDAGLALLCRRGLVHPAATAEPGDDVYRFHHVLIRDAAYATLTKADRAGLHERVAEWLDRAGSGDDALVGYHLEQAALYHRELGENADELAARAGERLGRAGLRAMVTTDGAAADGLLERAVALLPIGERRAEFRFERSLVFRLHGEHDQAEEELARADRDASRSGSARISARVACERALSPLNSGELALDDALAIYARAEQELRAAADSRGLSRAELFRCNIHALACRSEENRAAAERAEEHYLAAGWSPGISVRAQAWTLYRGPIPVAECVSRCLGLLERIPDAEFLLRPQTDQSALSLARQTDLSALAGVTATLGGLRALEGRCDDGRLLLADARSLYERIGDEHWLRLIWSPLLIDLETVAGNHDVAESEAQATLTALRAAGTHEYGGGTALQLAELLLDRGETTRADELVGLVQRDAIPTDALAQFWSRRVRARLLARADEFAEAESMARDAVAIASSTDALVHRACTHLALAEVLQLAGKSTDAHAEATTGRRLLRQKGATGLLSRYRTPVGAER